MQARWPRDTAVVDVALEEFADHEVLLGAGEQPWWRLTTSSRVCPQQAERVGVEGARNRLADGAVEAGRDALAKFGGRSPTERQDERLVGSDLARLDALHDSLDDRGRLTRAGPGKHEHRAASMLHRPSLCLVKNRRHDAARWRPHHSRYVRRPTLPPATRRPAG